MKKKAKSRKAVEAKRRPRPRMAPPKTMKGLLKVLGDFFHRADEEETKLAWDVLTGLRGPDSRDHERKSATTAVIRHAVFGMRNHKIPAAVHADEAGSEQTRSRMEDDHFRQHAYAAFEALGLKWDEVNQ